jgi:hypothetical protein
VGEEKNVGDEMAAEEAIKLFHLLRAGGPSKESIERFHFLVVDSLAVEIERHTHFVESMFCGEVSHSLYDAIPNKIVQGWEEVLPYVASVTGRPIEQARTVTLGRDLTEETVEGVMELLFNLRESLLCSVNRACEDSPVDGVLLIYRKPVLTITRKKNSLRISAVMDFVQTPLLPR